MLSNANGTIVASAINYWQTLPALSGSIAVGFIVQVRNTDAALPSYAPFSQCAMLCAVTTSALDECTRNFRCIAVAGRWVAQ